MSELDPKTAQPPTPASEPDAALAGTAVGAGFRPIKRLRERAVERAIERARAEAQAAGRPFDEDKARKIAEGFMEEAGDRPFLEWLMSGGLESIIAMIVKLIEMFG